MKSDELLSTKIKFQIPYINEAFSHLMYHEFGYRCNTSFDIEDIGSRRTDPALTANENILIANDILYTTSSSSHPIIAEAALLIGAL